MNAGVRETTVLVPAGATSAEVVEWSSTDPHAGVRATVRAEDGDYPLTIHTIVRAGERLTPGGVAHGVMTDARTLASSAVWSFLAAKLPPVESDAQRPAVRAAAIDVEQRAEAAAALVHDLSVWTVRPVVVEGDEFALHVHSFPDGFAAFADFGIEVITMHGPRLPGALSLRRRRARGQLLLPEA